MARVVLYAKHANTLSQICIALATLIIVSYGTYRLRGCLSDVCISNAIRSTYKYMVLKRDISFYVFFRYGEGFLSSPQC